ncbi:hypothetical protein CPB86DRAFT_520823 [Serendipita vermifera]|nr:hypothetical protein CPB86DRAFT_520823 [Serendipita vermifera]
MAFIDEIKLLTGVKTVQLLGGFIPRELALLFPTLYRLPNLSLLIVFGAPEVLKYLNPPLPSKIRIETTLEDLVASGPVNPIPILSTLHMSLWNPGLMKSNINSFISLHTLALGTGEPLTLNEICEAISPLKRLVVLSFSCTKYEENEEPYLPTALTALKDLRIRFRKTTTSTFTKLLEPVVRCIAGESRLGRLDIKSLTGQVIVVGTHAPEFISHVLSTHSSSLLKLRSP